MSTRSEKGLVVGFLSIAAILSLVIALGIGQMTKQEQRLNSIVDNNLVKLRLVNTMRVAARERTLLLHRMIAMKDPFERHDEWMRFNANASKFAEARIALVKLDLSDLERRLLDEQAHWTGLTVPVQNQVVELAMGNKVAKARALLHGEAIPQQNKVLQTLDLLSKSQEEAALLARERTNTEYQTVRVLLILLALAAIILSMFIAYKTIRYVRKTEGKLYNEKQKAEVTLYSIAEGVITTDAGGCIESLNAAAKHITGWSTLDVHGKRLRDMMQTLGEGDDNAIAELVDLAVAEGGIHTASAEVSFLGNKVSDHVIEASAAPIRDETTEVVGAVLIFRDITEMHALSHELRLHASHDSLTGLINRREFEIRLTDAIHDARENSSEHALCFMDLDMFKMVNDTCGHAAGDELLRQIASGLSARVRKSDVIARLGGDEFGLLLHNCSLELAREVCEDMREKIKHTRFIWEDNSFEIGVSIGIVPVNETSGSAHEALRAVGAAVYEAKDQGRNRICVHDAKSISLDRRQGEISWVQTINQALEQGRLKLYYQEIKPLQEALKDTCHAELLLRMEDNEKNIVTPMSFLPAAERFHLMPMIDRWVVHAAFTALTRVKKQGSRIRRFNINLSGQSLSDPELLDYIRAELALSGITASDICFEITETAAISNLTAATRLIEELRKIGFRFALDDFGSGLSSFAYLKNLKVDYLKIDGTFIRDIATDTADHAMVRSINQVAHVMGIKTVAEYIENLDTNVIAAGIGIDYGQGIFLAEPLPIETLYGEHPGGRLRVVK